MAQKRPFLNSGPNIAAIERSLMLMALVFALLFKLTVHSSVIAVSKDDPLSFSVLGTPVNSALLCGPARTEGGSGLQLLCQDCCLSDTEALLPPKSPSVPLLALATIYPASPQTGPQPFKRPTPFDGRAPPVLS